jgi:His/Glu/Gln/Arg/opine family amino acid ABC transporter permease subunit
MGVIWDNLPYMLRGLQETLLLAVVSLVGSFALGTVLAVMRSAPWRWLRIPVGVCVDLMRMIPLIMVMFWMFFMIPILTGHSVSPLAAALAALIVFNASYMAEIIRAGIAAVPRGLSEAARASGFGALQCMGYVVLPLAFKSMLPAMVNRFVTVFMATSLAYTIGVTEFFRAASEVNFRVFRPDAIFSFVGVVYFAFCYALSLFGQYLAARLARSDRNPGASYASTP